MAKTGRALKKTTEAGSSFADKKTKAAVAENEKKHGETRFVDRVKRLQAKGSTKKEAEKTVAEVITTKEGSVIEGAHIHVAKDGSAFFKQGDIMFSVDNQDINKVVGCNGEMNVLDKLMDSQIASLATANGLPISPFVRELLIKGTASTKGGPLTGLVQSVWYRDIDKHTSDYLNENQQDRVIGYIKALAVYKPKAAETGSDSSNTTKRVRATRTDRWSRSFKFVKATSSVASGRASQLLEVMKTLKQGTFTEIVEASKGKVQTKQELDVIVDRFLKELVSDGAVVEVSNG